MSSYNFCPRCGAKLMPDARFCVECGTPMDAYEVKEGPGREAEPASGAGAAGAAGSVDAAEPAKSASGFAAGGTKSARGIATEAPEEGVSAETTRVAAVADNAGDAAAENGKLASEGSSAPSASSLTAAVESTKHRSRRRVPLVVLVALALALTASVAFAAYQVYTQVIAPAMQAQQVTAPAQTEETGESKQNGEAEGQTDAEMIEKAEAAYQVVIDDYKSALADYAQQGSSYDQKQFTASHPYLYTDRLCDSTVFDSSKGTELYYAFAAYAGNDTPIMLVKTATEDTVNNPGSSLVAIYTLVDGKPSLMGEIGHEHKIISITGNGCLSLFQMSSDKEGNMIQFTLYFEIGAQGSATYEKARGEGSYYINGAAVSLPNEPSCIKPLGSISTPMAASGSVTVTHPDGTTEITESSNSGNKETSEALKAECEEACQETLDIEWIPLS